MSSFSAIRYPSNYPLDSLKILGADTIYYVSTTGNDTTGSGTTAAPFASLGGAMAAARQYIITGNSTLTIRLLPGEYTLTENVDLYHPQGNNIIIEGDPSSLQQRTVWRVQNYTWSLGAFAGGGHTGTINLFDGTTTSGCTLHGFTGSDAGRYFTIVNAAIGSRSGYYTNGSSAGIGGISAPNSAYSTSSSYDPLFYGDRFFNHGYSFEEGNAILGVGRIVSAPNQFNLNVEFSNLNYDGRCPAWHEDGGIANTSPSWGGVVNNYPETQYSQPNGYYGYNGWRNESANVSYPSRVGSDSYITPDPFVLTTYPVVLRAAYNSNAGTLYLKNGNIKAIRNLFFAANSTPFTLNSGATGATLNYSQAISAFSDHGLPHDTNGTAISLENATIGIRHLGFLGVGTAVSAVGSKIVKHVDHTIDADGFSSTSLTTIGSRRYAVLNSLDNTPVLCTTNCQQGIVAKNSTIDLTDGSGLNREYMTDYRDGSVYISATSKPIALFGSDFSATSVATSVNSMVPNFKTDIVVPIFPGTTAAGNTAAFIAYAGSTGFWSAYPMAKAYLRVAGGSRQEIGFVNYVEESTSPVSGIAGSTVGVSYVNSVQPTEYRRYTVYGLKTAPSGLSFMSIGDIKNGITSTFASPPYGGTFEIEFYSGLTASTVSSYYAVGNKSVLVKSAIGTTYGILGMTLTAGATNLASNYVQSFSSYGADKTYLGNFFDNRKTGVQVFDGSKLMIEKALLIENGGAVPLEIAKNSSCIVGDGIISANKSLNVQTSGQTDGTLGSFNYNTGFLSITGFAHAGVHCWDNSSVIVGTMLVKHPTSVNCFAENDVSSFNGKILKIEQSSRGILGSLYALLSIGNSSVIAANSTQTPTTVGSGTWKSRNGIGYGFASFDPLRLNGFVAVERNSSLLLELASGSKIFHFDGGSPNWRGGSTAAPRNTSLITAKWDSSVLVGNVQEAFTPYADAGLATRFTVDVRSAANAKISTRSSGNALSVYNTAGITRPWSGTTAGGFTGNIISYDVNIGNYANTLTNSTGQRDLSPPDGVTYCTSFSGFSKIIII